MHPALFYPRHLALRASRASPILMVRTPSEAAPRLSDRVIHGNRIGNGDLSISEARASAKLESRSALFWMKSGRKKNSGVFQGRAEMITAVLRR